MSKRERIEFLYWFKFLGWGKGISSMCVQIAEQNGRVLRRTSNLLAFSQICRAHPLKKIRWWEKWIFDTRIGHGSPDQRCHRNAIGTSGRVREGSHYCKWKQHTATPTSSHLTWTETFWWVAVSPLKQNGWRFRLESNECVWRWAQSRISKNKTWVQAEMTFKSVHQYLKWRRFRN